MGDLVPDRACATASLGPARTPSSMCHLWNKRDEHAISSAMAETNFCKTRKKMESPCCTPDSELMMPRECSSEGC